VPAVIPRLLRYVLQDRAGVRRAVLLLSVATAADVGAPVLIKIFIDDYLRPGWWPVSALAFLVAGYLVLQWVAVVAGFGHARCFARLAVDGVRCLREEVFAKVLSLPVAFFDRNATGALISRMTNDTESIKEFYVNALSSFVENGVRIVGIFVAMAWLDWRLLVICLVFAVPVGVAMFAYRRLSAPRFHALRERLAELNTQLHESLQGLSVIRLFGRQQRFRQRFRTAADEHYRARMRCVRLDALMLRPLVDLLQLLLLAGLLALFGFTVTGAPFEVGVMYVAINYLGRFVEPVIEIAQRLTTLQQAVAAGQRVFALLDEPVAVQGPPKETVPVNFAGEIVFDQVSFGYSEERCVIHDVSFSVPGKGCVAIVGSTGSGKSTLAALLAGFYVPRQGRIQVDGVDLNDIGEARRCTHMALVQQDPMLFSGTVADNIRLGRPLSDRHMAAVAREVGVHDLITALPAGYETVLQERGRNLSMGQRQVIALVRALAGSPSLLILDEVSAHVDSHTEKRIHDALTALRGRVTLIIITHRLAITPLTDRIVVLRNGRIVEQGTYEQLMSKRGMFWRMVRLQSFAA